MDRNKLIPIFEMLRKDTLNHEEASKKIETIFNCYKEKKKKEFYIPKKTICPR